MSIESTIIDIAKEAKKASSILSKLSSQKKDKVLIEIANRLRKNKKRIQKENEKDLKNARSQALSDAFIDRLRLDNKTIESMASQLEEIVTLPDPVGEIVQMWKRPNNLVVGKMRIPLGVVGIIYESRPNVTVDAAGLCLKSGNAVILRGGKEAINSNKVLGCIIQEALRQEDVPPQAVQVVPIIEREAVQVLLKQNEYIDVIIPRGGESLIRTVNEQSSIPVIAHYKGVCHIFIDESADYKMAESIVINAKTQRPGVCNAVETLLVHKEFAKRHLSSLLRSLKRHGVEIRGCPMTCRIVKGIKEAKEEDWYEEYLALVLSVKVVSDIDEAIAHITKYGSMHTEAIVTEDYHNSQKFLREVNSSVVLVNASTRFNDGNQLGLGAEIGISTSKIHAFGPMGLKELTTTKFIVFGDGQIRES